MSERDNRKIEVDTKTFLRFWGVVIGLFLVGAFLYQARIGLLIVGASIFLAVALNPLISKISKHLPGKSRSLATFVSYILVVFVIGGTLFAVVPVVVSESVHFAETMPTMMEKNADNWSAVNNFIETNNLEGFRDQFFQAVNSMASDFVKDFGSNLIGSVGQIVSGVTALVLILVLTFLMLVEGPAMYAHFWSRFKKNESGRHMQSVLFRMSEVVAGFVNGQLLVALIDAFVSILAIVILCAIFGIQASLAIPLGLVTGILSLIPLFGAITGGILVSIVLAFNVPIAGLIFIIFFIIYQQIEANVIVPKIQSKRAKLPALIILVAATIGIYVFGLLGAIVAIPVAGCIKILFDEYVNINGIAKSNQ